MITSKDTHKIIYDPLCSSYAWLGTCLCVYMCVCLCCLYRHASVHVQLWSHVWFFAINPGSWCKRHILLWDLVKNSGIHCSKGKKTFKRAVPAYEGKSIWIKSPTEEPGFREKRQLFGCWCTLDSRAHRPRDLYCSTFFIMSSVSGPWSNF